MSRSKTDLGGLSLGAKHNEKRIKRQKWNLLLPFPGSLQSKPEILHLEKFSESNMPPDSTLRGPDNSNHLSIHSQAKNTPSMLSSIYPLIHSCTTCLPTHSSIHLPSINLPTYALSHQSTHQPVLLLTNSSMHHAPTLLIHPFTPTTHPKSIHAFMYFCIHRYTYASMHSSKHVCIIHAHLHTTCLSIHPCTYPPSVYYLLRKAFIIASFMVFISKNTKMAWHILCLYASHCQCWR